MESPTLDARRGRRIVLYVLQGFALAASPLAVGLLCCCLLFFVFSKLFYVLARWFLDVSAHAFSQIAVICEDAFFCCQNCNLAGLTPPLCESGDHVGSLGAP